MPLSSRAGSSAYLGTLATGAESATSKRSSERTQRTKTTSRACDNPRRNDLDGRGNLSEDALSAFTAFFLDTCIDQVRFTDDLVQPDRRTRVLLWAGVSTSDRPNVTLDEPD